MQMVNGRMVCVVSKVKTTLTIPGTVFNTGLSKLMHQWERAEEKCMVIFVRPETKRSIHSVSLFDANFNSVDL